MFSCSQSVRAVASALYVLPVFAVFSFGAEPDVVEDFEDSILSSAPQSWNLVGSDMSIEAITDPEGVETLALRLGPSMGVQGIYRSIEPQEVYCVSADVWIEQYSDVGPSGGRGTDWPMYIGPAQADAEASPASWRTVGLYASSQTRTWHFFDEPGVRPSQTRAVDFEVAAQPLRWYRLSMQVEMATKRVECRVVDLAEGMEVVNQTVEMNANHSIFEPFDAVMFIDGELSAQMTPNIAVIDNLSYTDGSLQEPLPTRFLRGDCNDNGEVDISDGRCILDWRFSGAPAPGCLAATDTGGDGRTDIADAIYLFNALFLGGPPPTAPFPECGTGTEADVELGCAMPPGSCR
jgi:hypothetical protein